MKLREKERERDRERDREIEREIDRERESSLLREGFRNAKLVQQTPQILLMSVFFQRKLGYVLSLSNIN